MKATFADFVKEHSNCKKFARKLESKLIFDDILSKDDNIITMIDFVPTGNRIFLQWLMKLKFLHK